MSENHNGGRVAAFGAFRFDLSSRELFKNGIRLRLEQKPALVLQSLIENAGSIVTRESLHRLLWPDGIQVDFNHGLNKAVNRLRALLGDDRGQPRYIQTLSRRGYRFVAPVEIVCETKPANAVAKSPEQPLRRNHKETLAPLKFPPLRRDRIDSGAVRVGTASNRWMMVSSMVVASLLLVMLLTAVRFFQLPKLLAKSVHVKNPEIKTLVIEKNGGLDPIDEGFKLHPIGKYETEVVPNASHQGWDRWRIISEGQAYYYRTLTGFEKDYALRHDWKLTCVCALEQGGLSTNIDFGPGLRRFDIELVQDRDRYYVALSKQISPDMKWDQEIEFPGVGDVDHPHTYELRYDHSTQTAGLWIDGRLRASGYRGHTQFVEDRGLIFGAYSYLSAKPGIGVFRRVRFEVD